MKPILSQPLSLWFARATAGLSIVAAGKPLLAGSIATPNEDYLTQRDDARSPFGFAYDGVLGTSLDAQLEATSASDARECERRVLAEIDRLEKILSTRLPASEINRVRAGAPIETRELADVLAAYDRWAARTGGALSSNLSGVVALWREAARTGQAPEESALAAAFASSRALNIDALGKAYIVDRAVAIAREFAPGGLLNIGGDLRAWGNTPRMIDVANPFDSADNAPPLTHIPLHEAAIATSGGYARNFSVGAQRYSHLIDPRTLWPVVFGRAATAVASDCVSANALATALCVLDVDDGVQLARTFALDHLRFDASGDAIASGGFATFTSADTQSAEAPANAWPDGFQMNVTVSLKTPDGFRAKRPYVAVWVEDAQHKVVRTITVWGNGRYQPDLTKFWRAIGGNRFSISNVTRATRYPGAYTVTWDGRDQHGQPVPQGDYTVFVEINREHGHHVSESTIVTCGTDATTAEIRETAESDAGPVEYGPKAR